MQQSLKVSNLQDLPPKALRRICDILIDTKTHNPSLQDPSPSDNFIGLHTVLSLIRTSRVLHEHAADALWDTIPGFGILVCTLPREFWRPVRVGGPAGPIELELISNRPMGDADLLRFNHYAPRVKRILLPSACFHLPPGTRALSFSPNILDAFESRPYGRVLPNLRVLCCSPDLRHYADFYRSFSVLYGPNVQEVYTHCPYMNHTAPKVVESHWKETLARLHALAPNLTSLNLNASDQPFRSTISSLPSRVVSATSQNLHSLRLCHLPINLNAVRHISALPFLSALAVRLDDEITANDLVLLFRPRTTCFPALRELHLFHSHNIFLLTLFIHLTRPANARLSVIACSILEMGVSFHLVTNLLDNILEHEHVHSLTAISVNCAIDPHSPGPHMLTEAHLRPFFKLNKLRWFQLGIRCDFDINNSTLRKVVAAWPNLTVLILGPSATAKTSKVNLNGLLPLVCGCPHLKTLGLTIDATIGTSYAERPVDLNGAFGSWLLHGPAVNMELSIPWKRTQAFPHLFKQTPQVLDNHQGPLEELRLGRSSIEDPAAVAGFLSCFFPKLKYIRGTWRHAGVLGNDDIVFSEEETREIIAETECAQAWQAVVNRILPEMVRIRRLERNRRLAMEDEPMDL